MSQRVTSAARRLLACLPLLLLSAWPLRAQPRRAQLFDSSPPATVSIPEAVRTACQRLLPALAADPAASWVAYSSGAGAATCDTLVGADYEVVHLFPPLADTLRYHASVAFEPSGRVHSLTRELPADSLPWRIRRRLRQCTDQVQRVSSSAHLCLIVVFLNPHQRHPRYRAHYTFYFYDPAEVGFGRLASFCEFWRSGRPVKQPHFR